MKTKQRNFKKKKPSLLASHLANKYFKGIRKNLEKARSADTADSYINKGLNFSLMVSIVLSFVFFFIIRQTGRGIGWAVGFFIIAYIALFIYFINIPSVMIMRLQRDVDKQLLFAARHMLISIDAGQTLISAMGKIAKHDYGKASDMFSEVIKDIELGKSLEESIEHAIERSPSEILTKLFIEIDNSLKIGTDISTALKRLIKEMTEESELAIQRYNKKMNSMTLFYLILGVVFPSIGIAMIVIFASLSNLNIQFQYLLVLSFFLLVVQGMFLSFYNNLRGSISV